jgi:catechol 2,3-dioxygenase-like lactoylglutathione lyase family enzyme
MKLDHIAYRVADRNAAARLMTEQFGYLIVEEFLLDFNDGTSTRCYALQKKCEPDQIISDGAPGSVVNERVKARGNMGGVHPIAYFVDDVAAKMKEWTRRGVAKFTTDEPVVGPGLIQAFTEPHPLTGMIYELINRDEGVVGFNAENVKRLMESTKGL